MSQTINRRFLLELSGAVAASVAFGGVLPRRAQASGGRDARFIVIILRGALDGLAVVPPTGDPGFGRLKRPSFTGELLPLDGFFSLHPAMPNLARQYHAGQAIFVHASATSYRDRSHFDGQDVLESGIPAPGHTDSGWLNRFLFSLPVEQHAQISGITGGSLTPLVLRGPAPVLGWSPAANELADSDLTSRLQSLYADTDQSLRGALDEAIKIGRIAGPGSAYKDTEQPNNRKGMVALAHGVAKILAKDDGPRVAAIAFEGWDTHANEGRRLSILLDGLDAAFAMFESALGARWNDTTVLAVTEFGRTAAFNGTDGTDHGTGAATILTGGALKGGHVIADWPGLALSQLYDGRDLMPTTDLRSVTKGVLQDLYGVSMRTLASDIFPSSEAVRPMSGLIA